jgi:hypothetical protein
MNPGANGDTVEPQGCPPHEFEEDLRAVIPPEIFTHENLGEMRSELEFVARTCRKCGAQVYPMEKR